MYKYIITILNTALIVSYRTKECYLFQYATDIQNTAVTLISLQSSIEVLSPNPQKQGKPQFSLVIGLDGTALDCRFTIFFR
jgi:hypothetical protein